MTRVDWLEIDGKRYDERSVSRVTEYRCDVCGEFVAEPVIVQMTLIVQYRPASLPQYYLHPACARECLSFALPVLSDQGVKL